METKRSRAERSDGCLIDMCWLLLLPTLVHGFHPSFLMRLHNLNSPKETTEGNSYRWQHQSLHPGSISNVKWHTPMQSVTITWIHPPHYCRQKWNDSSSTQLKLIQIGQISFSQHLAFEQPFKINIIVSPAKAIRYPTKDVTSKKHSQHVDGVIYCPVKIHISSKDNLFDFKPEASLLTNKPIVFYKGAFHHRSIIDEILFGALLSTQLSLKEKTFTFFF